MASRCLPVLFPLESADFFTIMEVSYKRTFPISAFLFRSSHCLQGKVCLLNRKTCDIHCCAICTGQCLILCVTLVSSSKFVFRMSQLLPVSKVFGLRSGRSSSLICGVISMTTHAQHISLADLETASS